MPANNNHVSRSLRPATSSVFQNELATVVACGSGRCLYFRPALRVFSLKSCEKVEPLGEQSLAADKPPESSQGLLVVEQTEPVARVFMRRRSVDGNYITVTGVFSVQSARAH